MHVLDQALQLAPQPALGDDHYAGSTSPAYWNMVGPFGGTTAAALLQAVMRHPQRLGEPVALTVNFAAAIGSGAFNIAASPVRTNRSTQHWTLSLLQADAQGVQQITTTATAVTAVRRETWSANDTPMPRGPSPNEVDRMVAAHLRTDARFEWLQRYDLRPVAGAVPTAWDGAENTMASDAASLSRFWVRDEPARPLDFPALAAMADVFYPRIWLRRAKAVPAGTVSITTYFHADGAQLAATDQGYLLGQARAQAFRNGFFDQTAQLWNEAGALLATSHQIVYYKE